MDLQWSSKQSFFLKKKQFNWRYLFRLFANYLQEEILSLPKVICSCVVSTSWVIACSCQFSQQFLLLHNIIMVAARSPKCSALLINLSGLINSKLYWGVLNPFVLVLLHLRLLGKGTFPIEGLQVEYVFKSGKKLSVVQATVRQDTCLLCFPHRTFRRATRKGG